MHGVPFHLNSVTVDQLIIWYFSSNFCMRKEIVKQNDNLLAVLLFIFLIQKSCLRLWENILFLVGHCMNRIFQCSKIKN